MAYPCVQTGRECNGCGDCNHKEDPRLKIRECPICGCNKNDYLFKQDGDIIGCEYCVTRESVWDE